MYLKGKYFAEKKGRKMIFLHARAYFHACTCHVHVYMVDSVCHACLCNHSYGSPSKCIFALHVYNHVLYLWIFHKLDKFTYIYNQ